MKKSFPSKLKIFTSINASSLSWLYMALWFWWNFVVTPQTKKLNACYTHCIIWLFMVSCEWERGIRNNTNIITVLDDWFHSKVYWNKRRRDGRINVFKRLYLSHWTSRNACNICVGFKTEIQCHIYCALCVFNSTVRRTLFSAWEFREGNLLNYSTNSFVFLDITID